MAISPSIESSLKTSALPALLTPEVESPEVKLFNTYLSDIGHKIPTPCDADNIMCIQGGQEIPLDIHRISLLDDHYIASSGWASYDSTLFWSMVSQQKPALIVKLSQEQPTAKDSLYWPNEIGLEWKSKNIYGPHVKCLDIDQLGHGLIKRTFEVKCLNKAFVVSQLDFSGWKDLEVPSVEDFEFLLKEVKKNCPVTTSTKRLLVHCEKGIGRTGTFLALHSTCTLPVEEKVKDGFFTKLIMNMRSQRPKPMVETPEQFVFLHQMAAKPPLPKELAPEPKVIVPGLPQAGAGLTQIQMAAIQMKHKQPDCQQYLANLPTNIEILFQKLQNFEENAVDIVGLCEKALLGLSLKSNSHAFDCPYAFDVPLVGLLGNPAFHYVFDNHYPDSKKLRKGAPLCIIKALTMSGSSAQIKACAVVENLIKDYLANCQGSPQDLVMKLIVYALSKGYYDQMESKSEAAANLRKWWGNSPEHLAVLNSKLIIGATVMQYNINL